MGSQGGLPMGSQGGCPWDPRVGPWEPLGLGDRWALWTHGPWGPMGLGDPLSLGDPWALVAWALGPVYYIYGSTPVFRKQLGAVKKHVTIANQKN